VLWLARLSTTFRPSQTGFANPRVAHIRGALGYHVHSYEVGLANIQRWRRGQEELFPTVIQVQTINRCNARCGMCPYPYTIHLEPREVMEDALFTKIVQECAGEPELRDFVPMAKNEPLLDPKLETRIAEFKAAAAPHQIVELVTNGSALTPARFQRLVESGVDLLTVSLSAATPETYQQVMQGLSWAQIIRNLDAITHADTSRINLFLRFIKQRDNLAEHRTFLRHWRSKGWNLLSYEVNNRAGAVQGYERLAPAKHALQRRMRKALGRRLFRVCPYAFGVIHVLQNGDVPFCTNDWKNREILGNVGNQSIREIYNTPRLQEFRALMRQGRYDEIEACKECSFRQEWL
jgi:radical SAM protein with 4Fe4S-binding SPASM domain